MPTTRSSKQQSIVPNGLSEEEVDSSDSEDEISKVRHVLSKNLLINKESSSSEEDDIEEIKQASPPPKKTKKIHWKKKDFIPPLADFTGVLPSSPPDDELAPIDYFYSMFDKDSIALLTDQSNLYSVQMNPNKPLCISQHEMEHFIGTLIMTGIYSFPTPRFFWMNTTRVESIASVMSRDRFLQIRKNLHVVDNSNQLFAGDPAFDRAYKVRPLLNIVKENFRKIPKEEKLSADEQIIPFKGRSIMKQHMPLKPNRWGYKMFVLAGGESGICYDFIFYTGKAEALLKSTPLPPPVKPGRPSLKLSLVENSASTSPRAAPSPLPSKSVRRRGEFFCCACREAFEREIHPTKTKLFPHHVTFIVNGYCDWKNAISRFKLHEKTKLHLDSIYVVNQQMKPNIAIQLTSATKKQQEQRRQSLSIQISCIIYLLRQGLALRGHDDENSNLIQLLKLRSADNEYLNEWIKNRKYFSHDIVNEICKEIYLTIIRDIVKEVRLYEISAQNAPTIVEAIYDVITRCGLDMINCRGQSYDGASNMSGIYGGVSSIILKQYSKAIYIHCVAHCLDLAVHDLTDQCASICNCMLCVKDIIDFIRRSPKRLVILKEIFNQISSSYTNLTALCPHRWIMRAESYGSLLKTYEQVQEALHTISKEKGGPGIKANGNLVFTDTEKLSRAFQSSDCYLQDVFCAAEAIIYRFRRIQDDINFELFYNQVVKDSEGLTEKPILPRRRRPPGRYESNTILVNHASCEDFYQKQYVETLEMIINMLQTRFTQKNFKMLCEVENFILNISNKPPDLSIDYIKTIIDFCYDDIDIERLKSEAVMISDFFKVDITQIK
ncbi:unnamed protein product [Rotaria sordida]|uniref:PiggyBac transposable element-derived protein domain-containing protein n=1 Tax=Rotaria sordida TaxID=392033 RepID=A0A815LE08_9BILA|nr:unnamed protein product [Rotaria sordida]CAF1625879.1 unnamed protein product [Rotaria sordida]